MVVYTGKKVTQLHLSDTVKKKEKKGREEEEEKKEIKMILFYSISNLFVL